MGEGLFQPSHLLIIGAAVVALFVFGPTKLPELGKSLGKTVKSVRDGMEGIDDDDAKPAEASSKTENSDN